MRVHERRRFGIIAATVAAVLIGGGVAVAYWTTTGTGTGTAGVGTSAAVTVAQINAGTTTDLFPGGPSKPIDFTITNGNAGPVYVNGVAVAVSSVTSVAPNGPVACDASDFTITQPSIVAGNIATGLMTYLSSSTGAVIAMVNKPAQNQDDCKNDIVSLTFTIN